MKLFSHRRRPPHLGPFPLERLPRAAALPPRPARRDPAQGDRSAPGQSLAHAMAPFTQLFDSLRDGQVAPDQAPIPESPVARSHTVKSACYFLGADMAGTCPIPDHAWLGNPVQPDPLDAEHLESGVPLAPRFAHILEALKRGTTEAVGRDIRRGAHTHALVVVSAWTREPRPGEPGAEWIDGTQHERAALRSAEIANVLAGYIRRLGYPARAHSATASEVDMDALLLACGLAEVSHRRGRAALSNPFLGERFGCAVVTTALELSDDRPLAPRGTWQELIGRGPAWWFGLGGTKPGWKRLSGENRPLHRGLYPMERIRRVPETTTFIDENNVPRVPKRHDMFTRAGFGDLGGGAQRELDRFVSKDPFAASMQASLVGMVPLQDGKTAPAPAPGTDDPDRNTEAVRALGYYMGADLVGVSRAPDYVWYSHRADGTPIEPYHKNAVVILLDQGFETMEGASGDDWISGSQSMRAYMHSSMICGVVAAHIRRLGWSARVHSVIEQDVLHIPLILKAGLGELSRIGELVLNPFVGPRFKSAIVTTDMPLNPDRPIDFGLQDFCSKCRKCARECPPQAIPYGDKILFNGYEIWKPDAQKCARFRITNPGGAACGRCMKTCPFNIEGTFLERLFLWAGVHAPAARSWIAKLDDRVGNGRINPVKKWWFDLEDVNGKIVKPKKINARQLNLGRKGDADTQEIAVFPIHLAPPPAADSPVPVDARAGREARAACEADLRTRNAARSTSS